MPLIIIGTIPEDTCYPDTLQALLELLAEHLGEDAEAGSGTKTLYIQASQPTGVPEETMWFEPVSKCLKFYGKAPGDTAASWMQATIPADTITGAMMQKGTVTSRELSGDVLAQLSAVAAATANSVSSLETFHGGGSYRANFFIMSDGTLRSTGLSAFSYAAVNRYKNGTGFVTAADASVLPKRCAFKPPLSGDTVAKVYAMQSATFVLTASGFVYATGLNVIGQLGLGDTTDRTIFQRIDPAYFDGAVVELAIGTGDGSNLSCYARTGTGKVYAWGHNYYGQLGLGGIVAANTNQPTFPTLVAALGSDNAQIVSAGAGSNTGNTNKIACYVRKTGGTVYGCGWNGDGNLGLGNTTSQSSFVQIDATNLTGITHIAAAGDNTHITFYAVKTSGADSSIWACGYNNKGQVGNGGIVTPQTSMVSAISFTAKLVTDLRAFATVGNFSALALLDDGTVRGWGCNANKQLGLGSGAGTANVTTPAAPTVQDTDANILFVDKIRLGGSGGKISTALVTRPFLGFDALAPLYDVYTAGSNQFGNLGLGHTTDTDTYTQVLIDTSALAAVTFGASNSHLTANTAALLIRLNNGACLACGWDGAATGQLGVDASPASISVPAFVNF